VTAARPSADRLQQIGFNIGNGAAGMASRMAERTANAGEATAKGIAQLVKYSMRSTSAFTEPVI
jgi:hypothetical protein